MSCPYFELLYHGTRGPGKTDWLLMDFAQHVGQGFGEHWRGILFRQTFPQLADVIAKSRKWFHRIFPRAKYNKSDHFWEWPSGEMLFFRYMQDPNDYWNYHGHEYPWVGWEEITTWASPECYHTMKACCRASHAGMPRKYRSTANPWGPGHNWVKSYFIDPAPAGVPFEPPDRTEEFVLEGVDLPDTDDMGEPLRAVHVSGHYSENVALMEAQPNYPAVIAQAATNPEQAKAWLSDDWDIIAGGMFDDVWSKRLHVISGWRPEDTPSSWRIDRAFDWGSSRPFSLGWWAESDGTEAPNGVVYPRGTLIRIGEWYGWNGSPNEGLRMEASEVASEARDREEKLGIHDRCSPGPADSAIYDAEPGYESIADAMAKKGLRFSPADKRPGTRKHGWEALRRRLKASKQRPMEEPGLFVFDSCRQFIRTVPTLPRDDRNPDDVNTDAEDHIADETRYRVHTPKRTVGTTKFRV